MKQKETKYTRMLLVKTYSFKTSYESLLISFHMLVYAPSIVESAKEMLEPAKKGNIEQLLEYFGKTTSNVSKNVILIAFRT